MNGFAVVEPLRHLDHRGLFQEICREDPHSAHLPHIAQVNYSVSAAGVVRGIHRSPYGKLVTCVRGRIFDVCVDLREGSPSYLQWEGVWLDEGSPRQVYIPAHCGHAFHAPEESIVVYAQEGQWDPAIETAIHPFDPIIGIAWEGEGHILSERDRFAPIIGGK